MRTTTDSLVSLTFDTKPADSTLPENIYETIYFTVCRTGNLEVLLVEFYLPTRNTWPNFLIYDDMYKTLSDRKRDKNT